MEEIKNEYRSLLIEIDNTQKEIIALEIDKDQLDNARLQMEKRYNFDPKNFVTERINGKDYYN
tara:strand:+ start:62 stop:250 length:189 start_codon:yes stop_codon:yes gene_type:complete